MILKKYNIIRLLFISIAILACSYAVPSLASSLKDFTSRTGIQFSPGMDLYFVQYAKTGSLTIIDSKQHLYQLTLKGVNPMTTYFSDRPYRVTGQLKTDQFNLQANEKRYKSFSGILSYFLSNNQQNLTSNVIDILAYQYFPKNNSLICKIRLKQNSAHVNNNNDTLQGIILQFDAGFFNNI